jgi:hypothetical protein
MGPLAQIYHEVSAEFTAFLALHAKIKSLYLAAAVLEGWLDAAASNTPEVLVLPIAPIRRYYQMAYWRCGWRPCEALHISH